MERCGSDSNSFASASPQWTAPLADRRLARAWQGLRRLFSRRQRIPSSSTARAGTPFPGLSRTPGTIPSSGTRPLVNEAQVALVSRINVSYSMQTLPAPPAPLASPGKRTYIMAKSGHTESHTLLTTFFNPRPSQRGIFFGKNAGLSAWGSLYTKGERRADTCCTRSRKYRSFPG